MTNKFEVLADDFVFLEGPRWESNKLWVSDMWGHEVFTIDEQGERSSVAKVAGRPSGLCFLSSGKLVIVSMEDRKLLELTSGGELTEYANLSGLVTGDINDAVVDAQDNIYVGNFGYDLFNGADPVLANLVCVDSKGESREVANDMNFPNGSVISVDNTTLICAETFANRLTAFTLGRDGSLSNRRVWAELGDRTPDGICLDQEGAIWVASFVTGEFIRVKEGGKVTHCYPVPGKKAVACKLGGKDGCSFFALTYEGELEGLATGERNARIEVLRVGVPGANSP